MLSRRAASGRHAASRTCRLVAAPRDGMPPIAMIFVLVWLAASSGVVADDATEAANRLYAAAAADQNAGRYEQAAGQWATFIDTYRGDPRLDRGFHYLGVCYLKTNHLESARQSFQAASDAFPKSLLAEESRYYLGLTQFALGQSGKPEFYDKAQATLADLVARYPAGKFVAESLYYQGESLYARGKKAEAAWAYARMVDKYPAHTLAADALYSLGIAQAESDQNEAAGASFERFLQKYPAHALTAEVQLRRGETLFAAGQFEAASQRFATAAAKAGFAAADYALTRQAAALVQLQRFAEAAEVYASVPARFPKSPRVAQAALCGGKYYYLLDKFSQSRLLLAKVPESDPGHFEAVHWTARCLIKENKAGEAAVLLDALLPKAAGNSWTPQLMLDQADAAYELPARRTAAVDLYAALAAKYPKDTLAPQALYMAGYTALGQGQYAAALRHAQAFLARYPDNSLAVDVNSIAAESHLQSGQPEEAAREYGRLLEKHPQHALAESWKVRRGLTLLAAKKYAETIAALEPALGQIVAPDALAEAHFLIGSSQAQLQHFPEAARSLEAALAASPHWRQADETLLALADARQKLNDLDRAKAALRRLLAEFPASRLADIAHYRLGRIADAAGDGVVAAAEYQQVAEHFPKSPLVAAAWHGLAWADVKRKDFAGAQQAASRLLEKYPQDKLAASARYVRAVARHHAHDDAAAVADLRTALAAGLAAGEQSDARYLLALCQTSLKQNAEAVETLQSLLRDDPKYAAADKVFYELGWALTALEKHAEAGEAFRRLVENHPDSPLAAESAYHAGESALDKNEFARAGKLFHTAAEKNPASPLAPDATYQEADCLMRLKRTSDALPLYESLQGKTFARPEFGVLSLLHGAQAAGELKRQDKRLALLEKAAKFADSPHLPEVLFEQASALQESGQSARAQGLFEQVIAKCSDEKAARAQLAIGKIQYDAKQYAEAAQSFIQAAYGYEYPRWQAEATFEAGRSYEALGKPAQAVKQYQELLKKYPQSEKAAAAKERLKEVKP